MTSSLNIASEKFRYHAMIGTGGIGAGSLFLLTGNHTLGREESRGGKYLDARDYCKLHIIAHNVKVLCGDRFPVFPVGKIGDDEVGIRIYREMQAAGLEMDYVRTSPGDKTLFGFCFLYPDGTGGNLTTEESACTKVDASFIEEAMPVFMKYSNNFVSLSAPEVPMQARKKLLELTVYHRGLAVASFTSGEMRQAAETGMLAMVDLLAMNIDEAAALSCIDVSTRRPEEIVEKTISEMQKIHQGAWLTITAGQRGSWSWDGKELTHFPAFSVEVKSSAGAGDAFISAVISGLVAGLTLPQAQILGSLAGAFAVTSQHTIHPEMGKEKLKQLVLTSNLKVCSAVLDLLADSIKSNDA